MIRAQRREPIGDGTAAKLVAGGRSLASVAERVELVEIPPDRGKRADAPERIAR